MTRKISYFINSAILALSLSATIGFGSAAFAQTPAQETRKALMAQLSALGSEIDALTADLSCEEDWDCQAVILGAKDCPTTARIISYANLNEEAFWPKFLSYAELSAKVGSQPGVFSACSFLEKPQVGCVQNKCAVTAPRVAPKASEWVEIRGKIHRGDTASIWRGSYEAEVEGKVIGHSGGVKRERAESMASRGFGAVIAVETPFSACENKALIRLSAAPGNFIPNAGGRESYTVPEVLSVSCTQ